MESKEEVNSDGSYEMVNFGDYASGSANKELSDDSSFELIGSEFSDEETKSFSSESAKGDVEYKSDTGSDSTEGEFRFKSGNDYDHTEGDMGLITRNNKGKKRDIMTMLYERSNYDLFDFPAEVKLKHDIKEAAKNHIIRYLPAKSLFKCRQVSKEWNAWISNPFFAHMQSQYFRKTSGFFQNSKSATIRFISLENSAYGVPHPSLGFLPERVSIKSSCNGLLLCQSIFDYEKLYICNPAIRQWVRLPASCSYHGVSPKFVLAFEPSRLKFEPCYQVICLFTLPYPDMGPVLYFDIYDSETNLWSESRVICPDLDPSDIKSEGVFVNGVVYWETQQGELLAFDLKNEIYSCQMLPFEQGGALTNIDGEICYVRAHYDHAVRSCMLDVYGEDVMSLKNTINVSVGDVEDGELVECTVLGNSCEDVVALVVKVSQGQKCLYVYHVKDKKVHGPRFFNHSKKMFPYVNSLVSIGN